LPLEVQSIQKCIKSEFPHLDILSTDVQYIAKSLVELDEEHIRQADKIIDLITDHPDVLNVYDNITGYPSSTIKLPDNFS